MIRTSWVLALLSAAMLGAGGSDLRLIDAVKAGNREAVRVLLAPATAAAIVNVPEADGTTALHWAVQADDVDTARLLVGAGANANAANRYGVTPLSLAAANANAAIVRLLLDAGADANATLRDGETILMAAARTGNPDAVALILSRGADVNAREQSLGETALMWAAAENHAATVTLLLDRGADVNARSSNIAWPKDRFGLEGVLTILPHGRWTPLMYAARQGALGAARTLVDAGATLNLLDPDGTDAMVVAIINGHYDVAVMLAEKGADPNAEDIDGERFRSVSDMRRSVAIKDRRREMHSV